MSEARGDATNQAAAPPPAAAAEAFRTRYPWDRWFDGQRHALRRGIDFTCRAKHFRSIAYQAALRRGLRIRTRRDDDLVVLQALPPAEPPPTAVKIV